MHHGSDSVQDKEPKITDEIQQAAKMNPNGWVYKLDAKYNEGKQGHIPFEGIIGWWEVNACGEIKGNFIRNPEYKPLNSETKKKY